MASASASSKGAKPRSDDKPAANRAAQDKLTPTKPPQQKRRLKVQGAKANGSKADVSKALPAKAPSLKLRAAKAPSAKAHAFLVAVKRRREALRVYAVQTASEAVALAIVEAASAEDATVEPVGRLSKKLAAPLKLLTGEPRLI